MLYDGLSSKNVNEVQKTLNEPNIIAPVIAPRLNTAYFLVIASSD
jgi:hypothetical protein